MNVKLETDRLLVRPWQEGDDVAAFSVYGDPVVREFTGGALDAEEMRGFVARRIDGQSRGVHCLQPLVEKATGAVVGSCGLQALVGYPDIEIGWMLATNAWGKGFASEIAREVLRYGLSELRLPRIVATIDKRNPRSVAVVNRVGMRFDRVIRVHHSDMLCYEITLLEHATASSTTGRSA